MNTLINIQNVSVDGIDIMARAAGVKHRLLHITRPQATRDFHISILRDINLQAKAGDKIGIIGANGCGKSSLLKVIANIYPPKNGSVQVTGKVAPIIEMGLGLQPDYTGRQNIKLGLLYTNQLARYSKALEDEIIAFSDLGDKIDVPFKYYSSGMRARLSFSICIFQQPDILLLDEVFAVGDRQFIRKSKERMLATINNVPVSVIVSHQSELLSEVCNRFILMQHGKIVADTRDSQLLKDYQKDNPETKEAAQCVP